MALNPLAGFRSFAPLLTIPSRELGMVKFAPLLPSQEFLLSEIERGLGEGIHDFTVLKGGRQSAVGGSTLMDAITLYYMQRHSGMVGLMVSDEDDNRDYRRDVMLQMLDSLPKSHRQAVRRDNSRMLAWVDNRVTGYYGSRLLFAAAGKREDKNVGRSKGINYNYNDEFGFWKRQKVYSALRASRAENHPTRLYVDISTANGINTLMHEEWKIAEKAVTRRAIFVSCWRNQAATCMVARTDPRWERYGARGLSGDEKGWAREVKRRYGVILTPEFWAWRRWKTAEEMGGDETLMSQEYGILPEECFQAFGDKFISGPTIQRLHNDQHHAPDAVGYDYDWGRELLAVEVRGCDPTDAPLRVWEEPDPQGVYVIAAHPWGSSGPTALENVIQVYRAWPDRLRQVAEFAADGDLRMYHFAWAILILCGTYKTWHLPYFVMEIAQSGQHVLAELERIDNYRYGLGESAGKANVMDALGSLHYLYRRLDTFSGGVAKQIKSNTDIRARLLYALRDEVEREHVEVLSPEAITQLATLRRGESGDADVIGGGGETEESRAICMAMAVEAWHSHAMGELTELLPPRDALEGGAPRVEQVLVADFLAGLRGR